MDKKKAFIQAKNIKTWFPIKRGIFSSTVGYIKAVNGVSLSFYKGETIGLVGESGCGKTSLGRTLMGLEKLHDGQLFFEGRDLTNVKKKEKKDIKRRMQMVFQNPISSLNPRMNVMDIITEGMSEFNLLKKSKISEARDLLNEVGINPNSIYRYPHEFSGGQRQRISIARAISLCPDFIVCDEAVSALDVSVQAQVINLLMDLQSKHNFSCLFISHDLSIVKHISTKIAVMYLGKLVEYGDSENIINNPLHPYTRALISAVPVPGIKKEKTILPNETPSPSNPPGGCVFHPRCPEVMDICKIKSPENNDFDHQRVWCYKCKDPVKHQEKKLKKQKNFD